MKVTTNFAPQWREFAFVFTAVLWLVAAAGVTGSIALCVHAVRLEHARPALVMRLAALKKRVRQIGRVRLPSQARLAALRQRVTSLNTLAGVSGWPLTRVLTRLERLLPREAMLSSLEDNVDSGRITLVAEAPSARTLTKFLARLQNVTHFQDVLLVEQQRYKRGGASWERCKLHIMEGGT